MIVDYELVQFLFLQVMEYGMQNSISNARRRGSVDFIWPSLNLRSWLYGSKEKGRYILLSLYFK